MLYSIVTDQIAPSLTSAVLPTELGDNSIAGKVTTVGENGPADGLMIAHDGKIYISSPQDNVIKMRDLSGNGEIKTLIQDARLR